MPFFKAIASAIKAEEATEATLACSMRSPAESLNTTPKPALFDSSTKAPSQFTLNTPDDCWELIFRSLDSRHHYDSVSSVCKRFLAITNSLHSSLAIVDKSPIPSLPRLFLRFPAINSIDLSHFDGDGDGNIHSVLRLISKSNLSLDSLDLSNRNELLVHELRKLGSTMRNLRVLRYSNASFIGDDVLVVIADCFPYLQQLDISFPRSEFHCNVSDLGIRTLATKLKDLRKVNLSGNRSITDESLLSLCENCEFLREIAIQHCNSITLGGIASAIRRRPTLAYISLGIIGFGNKNEGAGYVGNQAYGVSHKR